PDKSRETLAALNMVFQKLEAHGFFDAKAQPQEVLQGSKLQLFDAETDKMVTWDVRDVSRDALFADRSPEGAGQLVRELSQLVHPPAAADQLFQLLAPRLQKVAATLTPDDPATKAAKQAARDAVPLEKDVYSPGELLVKQNEVIKEEQVELLRRE